MYIKIYVSVQIRVMGNSNALFKIIMLNHYRLSLKDLFLILTFLCVRIEID